MRDRLALMGCNGKGSGDMARKRPLALQE